MNDDKAITPEKLSSLWSVNISKMHFQQNVCFQLRTWAFAITGVVIPLIWIGQSSEIRILLHFITILLIGLILHKDLSWHGYFFKYRDRSRLCEKAIVMGGIDMSRFAEDYFKLEKESKEKIPSLELLKSTFSTSNFFLLRTDYVELYLIRFLVISLVTTIVIA